MRSIKVLLMLAASIRSVNSQDAPVPPTMTLLYSMEAELGNRFSLGPVPNGKERFVIPIVGGHFKGPRMSGKFSRRFTINRPSDSHIGKVLNLGADWLLVDASGNARPDTRYNIQTEDGTYIYVQTEGPTLKDGRILLRGKFETSMNGTYAWMNDVVAVGVLNVSGADKVLIDMWQVTP
jgi:hypothetical protein